MSKRVYGTVKLSVTGVSARVALPSFNQTALVQDAADPAAPIYQRGQYMQIIVTNLATSPTALCFKFGDSTVVAVLPVSAAPAVPLTGVVACIAQSALYYAYNLKDTHIAAITDAGTCDIYVSLIDGKDLS